MTNKTWPDHLDERCGSCARFVRVIETVDDNGEVKRKGECLLMVWPPPLYETSTCSQYVQRGTFTAKPAARPTRTRGSNAFGGGGASSTSAPRGPFHFSLPEELLDMNADEFREVLREVIREHKPSACAIEGLFFAHNLQTALIMGEARGASMVAAAETFSNRNV